MATSQNGWPVDPAGANQDRDPIYADIKAPNGVLEGDVATVLHWVAERYAETVEPLKAGTCWGYNYRKIRGSQTQYSNHASGTAVDFNADQHPLGTPASETFTAGQIKACHAIVEECGGVVRWGGDYSGRKDPMHWEIVGTAKQVAALAAKIKRGELPMTLSADDKTWLSAEIAKATKAAAGADDAVLAGLLAVKIGDLANPNRTVGDVLRDVAKLRGVLVGDAKDAANAKLAPSSPLAHIIAAAGDVEEILAKLTPAS